MDGVDIIVSTAVNLLNNGFVALSSLIFFNEKIKF